MRGVLSIESCWFHLLMKCTDEQNGDEVNEQLVLHPDVIMYTEAF